MSARSYIVQLQAGVGQAILPDHRKMLPGLQYTVDAETFSKTFVVGKTKVIDVRKPGEYEAEHVDGADNVPLDFLNEQIDEFPASGEVYVHCAGGYRSMIALSILRARGWKNLIDVKGGFKSIETTNIPRTDFVCASKKVK